MGYTPALGAGPSRDASSTLAAGTGGYSSVVERGSPTPFAEVRFLVPAPTMMMYTSWGLVLTPSRSTVW